MKIIIYRNREVYKENSKIGNDSENKVEILEFEFPEEFRDFTKYIEFQIKGKKYVDLIQNDKYVITKAIAKYGKIKTQVVLKKNTEKDTIVFKSNIFSVNVSASINATEIVVQEAGIDLIEKLVVDLEEAQRDIEEINQQLGEFSNYDDTEIKEEILDIQNKNIEQDIEITSLQLENNDLKEEVLMLKDNTLKAETELSKSILVKDSARAYASLQVTGNTEQIDDVTKSVDENIKFVKSNKNIYSPEVRTITKNGVSVIFNENGTVVLNGECTANGDVNYSLNETLIARKNKTTLTVKHLSGSVNLPNEASKIRVFFYNTGYVKSLYVTLKKEDNKLSSTFTYADDELSIAQIKLTAGVIYNNLAVGIMLTDEVDTNYEPREEERIVFPFAEGQMLSKANGVCDYLSEDGIVNVLEQIDDSFEIRETPLITPYTQEQKNVWDKLQKILTNKNVTQIRTINTVQPYIRLSYVQDLQTVINNIIALTTSVE